MATVVVVVVGTGDTMGSMDTGPSRETKDLQSQQRWKLIEFELDLYSEDAPYVLYVCD